MPTYHWMKVTDQAAFAPRAGAGAQWDRVCRNAPWAPRHAASVLVYDNALWMVAGNNMTSDVWKLTRTN